MANNDVQGSIDNLKIVVTGGTQDVAESLNAIVEALKALRQAARGSTATNLNKVAASIGNLKTQLAHVTWCTRKINELADALERLSKYGNVRVNVNANCNGGGRRGGATPQPNSLSRVYGFSNFGGGGGSGNNGGGGGTSDGGGLSSVGGDLSSNSTPFQAINFNNLFGNGGGDTVGGSSSGILTRLNGVLGKLGKSVLRIAFYRAIRTVIMQITSAFSEGLQNAYNYSKSVNGEWAKAKDNITTSTTYLKNALGAMASELLTTLEPVITRIADRLAEWANRIAEFNAYLRGSDTYTKAVKKNVDELTRSLMSFDEINKLGNTDSSDAFTTETVSTGSAIGTLGVIGAIGTTLATWSITAFLSQLSTAIKSLQTISSLVGGSGISSALSSGAAAAGASGTAGIGALGTLGLAGALIAAVAGAAVYVKSKYDDYGILLRDYGDSFGKITETTITKQGLYLDAFRNFNDALETSNGKLIAQATAQLNLADAIAGSPFGTDGEFSIDYYSKNSGITSGYSDSEQINVYVGDQVLDSYYSKKYGTNIRGVLTPLN